MGQLADKLSRALGKDGKPVEAKVRYWSEDELNERIKAGSPVAPAMRWANEVPGWYTVASCRDALGEGLAKGLRPVDAFLAAHVSEI
jgi:hypothetical protein